MKRTSLFLLLCLVLTFSGFAQKGNGNVTTTDREVSAFDKLSLQGGYEVILIQGNTHSVKVETDENLQDKIEVSVSGDQLIVSTEKRIQSRTECKLYITSPDFHAIEVDGAAEITSDAPIKGDALAISVAGAAEIKLPLAYDDITADISGAGSLELKGSAESASFDISGAGNIETDELTVAHVEVSISGTGNANVNATEHLKASISGMGAISYKGNPTVDKQISGLGTLSRKK